MPNCCCRYVESFTAELQVGPAAVAMHATMIAGTRVRADRMSFKRVGNLYTATTRKGTESRRAFGNVKAALIHESQDFAWEVEFKSEATVAATSAYWHRSKEGWRRRHTGNKVSWR